MKNSRIRIPREWRLGTFFDKFPAKLKTTAMSAWIFPLIADLGKSNPTIVGTALSIRNGVLITAKHILDETRDATEHTNINRNLCALQVLPNSDHVKWEITHMVVHEDADLAVLFAEQNSNRNSHVVPQFSISRRAPQRGEWIVAHGYVKGELNVISRSPDGGGVMEISNKCQTSFGVVKEVYEDSRDSIMLPCPCFEVSGRFSPGMSGGPVFNRKAELCGIVSTGIEGAKSSFAVTLGPSLSQIYRI